MAEQIAKMIIADITNCTGNTEDDMSDDDA